MAFQEQTAQFTEVPKKPGFSFYAAWVFLTVLSMPVAFILDLLVLRLLISLVGDFIVVNGVRHITEDYLATFVFVPIVGFVMGGLQYFLLRRLLPRMGWWVPATAGGWIGGLALIALLIRLHTIDTSAYLGYAFLLMGLSIGLLQWLVMRQHVQQAGWWIAANVLGWGLLALAIPGNAMDQFGLLLLGLLPACATAIALAVLLKQPLPGS